MMEKIPKIIHQTWKNKYLPDDFKKWSNTWKTYNPTFEYKFYTDKDCFRFIYRNYNDYISLYNSMKPIEKADLFRYLVLHFSGGVYVDMDTECLKPIDDLLNTNNLISGYEYNNPVQYLQWFIACPKGHKTMLELANEIYYRSWYKPLVYPFKTENQLVYWLTGPEMFTKVLLCTNEKINILPKGVLGCFDKKLINDKSYLIHWFKGSWKKKKYSSK